MGCATSKLEDLPAVALCRDRCGFLDEAIRQRYVLAEAHVAYTRSLSSVASSLQQFLEHCGVADLGHISSPVLDLPPKHKGVEAAVSAAPPKEDQAAVHHDSFSDSSSHLNFHSDSDETSSSFHAYSGHIEYARTDYGEGAPTSFRGGVFQMNYMKSMAGPSQVVYEQRLPAMSEESVRYFGEGESSSLYHPLAYYDGNMYPNTGGSSYLYHGYSSPPPNYGSSLVGSESKPPPPPPPPSPPRASAWDFLNPFESYNDKYYPQYTSSSRDSRELREEEGIPDLEDEQEKVAMEVGGVHPEFRDSGYRKSVDVVTDDAVASKAQEEASVSESGPSSVSEDSNPVEYEVQVVEKDVQNREPNPSNGGGSTVTTKVFRDVSEVVKEIEVQFERAAESGNEIAKMLEAGKLPYHRKHQVASKLMRMGTPSSIVSSEPSTPITERPSTSETTGPALLAFEEEVGMKSGNLSSTLQKLYLWEKKLFNEVKAEEKVRIVHDRKVKKLKRMQERGADFLKVDATRAVVRSLSTKIGMAIQVVDKISVTINKIRDEELWPQVNELIQGLSRMWASMLECHRIQCQAIKQAQNFDPMGPGKKLSDTHIDATLQFEHELLHWTERFSVWVSAQKGFVRALNNWLLKCLYYEPEETPDGVVPFSPGRIGAPPVFVICNQWSQALDEIPDMQVVRSLHVFATSVFQRWERDKLEMQEMIVADKDLERKVRDEDHKIQKEIQSLEKKMVLVSGEGETLSASGRLVYQGDVSGYNFQASLQRIFEALESFTEQSVRVYEEISLRTAEQARSETQDGQV